LQVHFWPLALMNESPSSAKIAGPPLPVAMHPLPEPIHTLSAQNRIVALAGVAATDKAAALVAAITATTIIRRDHVDVLANTENLRFKTTDHLSPRPEATAPIQQAATVPSPR
jgi:hypothetical protein